MNCSITPRWRPAPTDPPRGPGDHGEARLLRATLARGRVMTETRNCEQCGAAFAPRREHARFCSARCRVAWNRQHAGDPPAAAIAPGWTITAVRDTIDRLLRAPASDQPHGFAAIIEAVWS